MAPASTKVQLQENLYQFDNLLSGLETLHNESKDKMENLLSDENISNLISEALDEDSRSDKIVRLIVERIGQSTIVNGVLRQIRPEIEKHIDAYIESQLSEINIEARIERLMTNRSNGVSSSTNSIQDKPMEELSYDSVEEIAERMRRRAGDRAWV
jgi:hypothetical protein